MAPAVSFVIPVLDDADRLRACLDAIVAGTPEEVDVEIVVADNGSTDGSAQVARERGARVLGLPGLRLGELRNRAASATRGNILAFVDADNEIAPHWIAACLDVLSDRATVAAGAPYTPPNPATWVQRLYDGLRRHPADRQPVDWLGSGNLAVRRAAFEEVGGFDTTLETCEDVDLCRKLRARGYDLVADRRMRNVHHGDPRTLGQVFFGELWRGRDNLRVSLRAPHSARTMASAVVPIVNLAAMAVVALGTLSMTRAGLTVAAGAAGLVVVAVTLRATMMIASAGASDPPYTSLARRLGDLHLAAAVAAAYEAGRGLALVTRARHGRRRAAVPVRGAA
jgi:hypothetical protein